MIEQAVPVGIALVTGVGVMFNRVNNRIHTLDRRIDTLELKVVESFVQKTDFGSAMDRMEDWMIRIEEKLDKLVDK